MTIAMRAGLTPASIRAAARKAATRLRMKDARGVAAVEFALIAPVMIGLYLSTVITTQAYMSSSKVALVARSLADVASRQAVGTAGCTPTTSGNPCLSNTDMVNILDAAALIMAPYSLSTLKMTLSRIDIVKDTSASPQTWAVTKWSVGYNSGVARPCNGANAAFTSKTAFPGVTNSTTDKPLQVGNYQTTQANYQNYLPSQYTTSTSPTGFLILADVVYTYSPGFSFKAFNWSNLTTVTSGWTQGFWSRTGLPIDGHNLTAQSFTPPGASSAVATTVTLCASNDPSNT